MPRTYLSVDGEAPDLAWREGGYLLLATPETLPVMRDNNAVQRAEGADIVLLDPPELKHKFAWLNTDGIAGGWQRPERRGLGGPVFPRSGIPAQGPIARRRVRA